MAIQSAGEQQHGYTNRKRYNFSLTTFKQAADMVSLRRATAGVNHMGTQAGHDTHLFFSFFLFFTYIFQTWHRKPGQR